MNGCIVHSGLGVTLLGAGEVNAASVTEALTIAPCLVAADGGADRALALGLEPEAVLGDLDSISPAARAAIAPGRLHRIAEQEGTDFDKCLAHVEAPFFLALGFGGGRLDHTLAAMATLARHPGRRLVWVGGEDVAFLAPSVLALELVSDGAGAGPCRGAALAAGGRGFWPSWPDRHLERGYRRGAAPP
jgi:thiamine pyrophosphokinase